MDAIMTASIDVLQVTAQQVAGQWKVEEMKRISKSCKCVQTLKLKKTKLNSKTSRCIKELRLLYEREGQF